MGIKILDCTLRDGAYVTEKVFKDRDNIIIDLARAGIDIIECGWLRDYPDGNVEYKIPQDLKINNAALMFDFGRYDADKLPPNEGNADIIRIAFYKKNLDGVTFTAEKVKAKGYKVFLQASNIMEYKEKEIENLCKRANYLGVDAVYIVDSFGSMFPEDLERILPIFNDTVRKNIQIGFHSHNSIQLSMGLTIQYINSMKRDIIVDSSLCGIGRGAGNCKTEILTEYLNRHGKCYDINLINQTIEKNILPLYSMYNWEYTPQRGLKGLRGLHPTE